MKLKFNSPMFIIFLLFSLVCHFTEVLAHCSTNALEGSDVISCTCWNCPDPDGCSITLYTHLAGSNPTSACQRCQTGSYNGYECQYASDVSSKKKSTISSSRKK